MSTRKRPLDLGSEDQSDFGNKRQKVTHNGANNNNNKEVTLELNNDIQKKVNTRLISLKIFQNNCLLLSVKIRHVCEVF